jgi:hypothetical protein
VPAVKAAPAAPAVPLPNVSLIVGYPISTSKWSCRCSITTLLDLHHKIFFLILSKILFFPVAFACIRVLFGIKVNGGVSRASEIVAPLFNLYSPI